MAENQTSQPSSATPRPPGATTILLVDDDPINLNLLVEALKGTAYQLLVARSGEEALRIASRVQPILILLDINMPGIDGYETCRQLKACERTRDAGILFLTALEDTQAKVKGFSLGAVDFISKPFDADEVRARVLRQIQVYQRKRHLMEENLKLTHQLQEKNHLQTDQSKTKLVDLICQGESDRLEFKSTLRWNLKTDKADRAIEKAWLKTIVAYLNTDGGILLVGVKDDGTVIGVGADCFENDDKYRLHVNNRIKEHIGLGSAACIRYDLEAAGDQKVLVIRCRPSPQPVFLKVGREEEFYIRVGPGSRKLTPSEVIDYVTRRQS